MGYLVRLKDGNWAHRGKPTQRIDCATYFPHPSSAKKVIQDNPGAELVPFAQVQDEWLAARKATAST